MEFVRRASPKWKTVDQAQRLATETADTAASVVSIDAVDHAIAAALDAFAPDECANYFTASDTLL
jgi:hypothetical protein